MSLEQQIYALFSAKKWTLSLAESCTGGQISARLVQIPGSSIYYLGGIVAYSASAKQFFLGIDPEWGAQEGNASENLARALATAAQSRFNSTLSLATTGIAGPTGGSEISPVGSVAFAVASNQNKVLSFSHFFSGTRTQIIEKAADFALQGLLKIVNSL